MMYERCSGLDVHQRRVVACAVVPDVRGRPEDHSHVRNDDRRTPEPRRPAGRPGRHARGHGIHGRAVETIFHILADRLEVLVVNAGHVKAVPGRKTDVADSEWLADLLQHGLLRASFIPDRDQRDLRDLTRTRTSLIDERSRTVRRLQKVLEDANIKLSSVATDIMGVSGRRSWPHSLTARVIRRSSGYAGKGGVLIGGFFGTVAVHAHQVHDHRVVHDAIDGRHRRHRIFENAVAVPRTPNLARRPRCGVRSVQHQVIHTAGFPHRDPERQPAVLEESETADRLRIAVEVPQ